MSDLQINQRPDASHVSVEYAMDDDFVTVSTESGNQIRVNIEDKNHISMDTPNGTAYLERQ